MGNLNTKAALGHCGWDRDMYPSVRAHLIAGGAVASAGILTLGLVIAPPDSNSARTEVRAVQLAGLAMPPPAYLGALEKFISDQAQTVVPVTKAAAGGTTDIATTVVNTPLTFDSAIDPAISSRQVNDAALAATTADLNPTTNPILEIIYFFTFAVPVAFVLFVVAPLVGLWQYILGVLGIPATASTVAVDVPETAGYANTVPPVTTDPLLSDSDPVTTATAGAADAAAATEADKAGVSPPVTSTDTPTETEQVKSTESETVDEQISTDTATSPKDASEIADTDEESTGPTPASAPEPSAASESEPAKPTVRPTTHRPVVRSLLGAAEPVRDQPRRGKGSQSTIRAADSGDQAATTGPSSADDQSGGGDDDS